MNSNKVQFCPRGHDTWKYGRYESNHGCRLCHKERTVEQRKRDKIVFAGQKGVLVYHGRVQFCPAGHDTWKTGRRALTRGCNLCCLRRSIDQRLQYPKRVGEHKRKWRLRNPEKQRQSEISWRRKNRLYDSLRGSVRRAIYRADQIDSDQFEELISYYGDRCVYCGNQMTGFDHLIPLNRGGLHELPNLAPACSRCNGIKKDRPIWVMLEQEHRVRPSSWYVPSR